MQLFSTSIGESLWDRKNVEVYATIDEWDIGFEYHCCRVDRTVYSNRWEIYDKFVYVQTARLKGTGTVNVVTTEIGRGTASVSGYDFSVIMYPPQGSTQGPAEGDERMIPTPPTTPQVPSR
jgi:hypothetical protein